METYDYVIVGRGLAGSVLTNRLAKMPAQHLRADAGPRDWHHLHPSRRVFINISMQESSTGAYQSGAGAAGPAAFSIYAPRGRTLGGSPRSRPHL